MNSRTDRIKTLAQKLEAKATKSVFLLRELVQARLHTNRKIRILFSPQPSWERHIRRGFLLTPHEISFDDFSKVDLKDYDLVVPLTISDLKSLIEIREAMVGNPIPIPSMQSVLLCDDKYELNNVLITKGYGSYIPRMGGKQTYPYMLKKRTGSWSENCHTIANDQAERKFAYQLASAEYFTQELITGLHEYATHILFKGSSIVSSINIEYVFKTSASIKSQDRHICTRICECPYLELFSAVLKSIGFEGLCCINYKIHNHTPMILEINPRFGGSLCPFFFSFLRHFRFPGPRVGINRIPSADLN